MSDAPGYWMFETSGVLKPAVEAYLGLGNPGELTPHHIAALRAYFRQWINAPAWRGPGIDVLRSMVDDIQTRADIERWLDLACDEGIDPL